MSAKEEERGKAEKSVKGEPIMKREVKGFKEEVKSN